MQVPLVLKEKWFWYSVLSVLCMGGWTLLGKLGTTEISAPTMQFLYPFGWVPVALACLWVRRFKLERSLRGNLYSISIGVLGGIGGGVFCRLPHGWKYFGYNGRHRHVPADYRGPGGHDPARETDLGTRSGAGVCRGSFRALLLMNIPIWFGPAVVVLITWGIAGLLQKLSTNHISAEMALLGLVVGFFLLDPWLYPKESLLMYSSRSLVFALVSSLLNALGAWALLAAMKNGGKASIVVPFTALYPLVTVSLAPLVLNESITTLQGGGVVCALIAVVLLSM
jgi:transporter family protein